MPNTSAGDRFVDKLHEQVQDERTKLDQALVGLSGEDYGALGFALEILIGRRQAANELTRWSLPPKNREISDEHRKSIFDPKYPQQVHIAEKALIDVSLGRARTYPEFDPICDEIATAVVNRLPRKLYAYHTETDPVVEKINIPDLGELSVEITSNEGIFTFITQIKSDDFELSFYRSSGRQYKSELNDCGRIESLYIKPIGLGVKLYEDNCGYFIFKNGVMYKGSSPDNLQIDVQGTEFSQYADTSLKQGLKHVADKIKYLLNFGQVQKLNWFDSAAQLNDWLKKNLLEKLNESPVVENQIETKEPLPAYIEKHGPLYTFIPAEKLIKYYAVKGDFERLDPGENYAVQPHHRLLAIGEGAVGLPSIVYDGYVYCGIGQIDVGKSANDYRMPDHVRYPYSRNDEYQLVKVTPKTSADLYVVDYAPPEKLKQEFFKHSDRLSDEQYRNVKTSLALTLVPYDQYQGNYEQPIVISRRAFTLDEIELIEGKKLSK